MPVSTFMTGAGQQNDLVTINDVKSLFVSTKSIVLGLQQTDHMQLISGRQVLNYPFPEWQRDARYLVDFRKADIHIGWRLRRSARYGKGHIFEGQTGKGTLFSLLTAEHARHVTTVTLSILTVIKQNGHETSFEDRVLRSPFNEGKENKGVSPLYATTSLACPQFARTEVATSKKRKGPTNELSNAHESSSESSSHEKRVICPPHKRRRKLRNPLMLTQPFAYPAHILDSRSAPSGSVSAPSYKANEFSRPVSPVYHPPSPSSHPAQTDKHIDWTFLTESEYDSEEQQVPDEQNRYKCSPISCSSRQSKIKRESCRSPTIVKHPRCSAIVFSDDGLSDDETSHGEASDRGYEGSSEWEGLSEASAQIPFYAPLILARNWKDLPGVSYSRSDTRMDRSDRHIVPCLLHGTSCSFRPFAPSPMNSDDYRRVARGESTYEPSPLNSRDLQVLEDRQTPSTATPIFPISRVVENSYDQASSSQPDSSVDDSNRLMPVFDWNGRGYPVASSADGSSSDDSIYPEAATKDMSWILYWAKEVSRSTEAFSDS
ncbi:hypothetical protein ACEPAG_9280 [Sanghuangporus baumii]